jgi:hypothetical protein
MARQDERLARYGKGLQSGIRENAVAFAYSLYATAAMTLLHHREAPFASTDVLWFLTGNLTAFIVAEAIASRGFHVQVSEEPSNVVLLGSAMSPLSIGGALAAVLGISAVLDGWPAWAIGPFAGTVVFLLLHGAESSLAKRIEERVDRKQRDRGQGA